MDLERLRRLWGETEPAPEGFDCLGTRVCTTAFEACMVGEGFDIGALPKPEQDRIFVSVIDALPDGDEAAEAAAVEMLRSLAVAGGWDDMLNGFTPPGPWPDA